MTAAFSFITKEWDDKANELFRQVEPYFDAVYVQVNGGSNPDVSFKNLNLHMSAFRWCDDFAKARNALHEEVLKGKHDFWAWGDTGDTIEGLEGLAEALELMSENDVDALYCKYEYEKDELGDSIADQWRERIISTSVKGEWKGAVHETFVPSAPVRHTRDPRLVWVHETKTEDEKNRSRERNHKILEALVYDRKGVRGDADPRDLYYLATSYFGYKDFEKAVPLYLAYIEKSGWEEEQYRAWKKIAESHSFLNDHEKAISAYMSCLRLNPSWKDAYLGIAECYHHMEMDERCLHWLNLSEQAQVPDSLSVIDPTVYTYRPRMMAAVSAARLGKLDQAYRMAKQVQKIQPNYEMVKQYLPIIEEELLDKKAIDNAKWLARYTKTNKGDGLKVFGVLPPKLKGHPSLLGEIQQYMEPKKWSEKSIVLLSMAATEAWGPDTLEKGMGGSEEAVVYLSRELARHGWEVTVYNDREDEYEDGFLSRDFLYDETGRVPSAKVDWKPWTTFNPADEFNAIIAWRNPNFFKAHEIKAKFKGVDMHDSPMGHQTIGYPETVDKFFFKSSYQAKESKLPEDKYVIVPNGIVPEQFE